MMTGKQLRHLREARGLTREQLAEDLKDCSASGIVKWESGVSPVPAWVKERMLRQVPLEMPLEELHLLLDRAQAEGISFPQLLARALRSYLSLPAPTAASPSISEEIGGLKQQVSQLRQVMIERLPKSQAPNPVKAGAAPNTPAQDVDSPSSTTVFPQRPTAEKSVEHKSPKRRSS